MEIKHTPGTWIAVKGGGFDKEVIITTYGRMADSKLPICELDVFFDDPFGSEQEANAHLIAAAPDLLEALEYMLETNESGDNAGDQARAQARAAIAKAKGEAQ